MRKILTTIALFFFAAAISNAATITLSAPSAVNVGNTFSVDVLVTNAFAGRGAGDFVTGYGFNVTINSTLARFTGETAGPLFDDFSAAFGGTPAVAGTATALAGVSAANFTLATLRFSALGPGTATIGVSYDVNDPNNQGLFYSSNPVGPITASTAVRILVAAPEPATLLLGVLSMAALGLARGGRRI